MASGSYSSHRRGNCKVRLEEVRRENDSRSQNVMNWALVVGKSRHPAGMKAISPAVAQRLGVGGPPNSPTPKGSQSGPSKRRTSNGPVVSSSIVRRFDLRPLRGRRTSLHRFLGWRFAHPRLIALTPSGATCLLHRFFWHLIRLFQKAAADLPSCARCRYNRRYEDTVRSANRPTGRTSRSPCPIADEAIDRE